MPYRKKRKKWDCLAMFNKQMTKICITMEKPHFTSPHFSTFISLITKHLIQLTRRGQHRLFHGLSIAWSV